MPSGPVFDGPFKVNKEGRLFLDRKEKAMEAMPYDYVIIWRPTKKQADDENAKPKIVGNGVVLAGETQSAILLVGAKVPKEFDGQEDQLDVFVRPFALNAH
jgi:hypothetical protein